MAGSFSNGEVPSSQLLHPGRVHTVPNCPHKHRSYHLDKSWAGIEREGRVGRRCCLP